MSENYLMASGTVGIRCVRCQWAPPLDEVRARLSGSGSVYDQAYHAARGLLAEHECEPNEGRTAETAEEIRRMAGYLSNLDPVAGLSLFEHAAELAARLQQVHRDGFSG